MGPAHGKDSLGTFDSAVEAAVAVARRYGQPQEPQEEAGQSQQEELCAECQTDQGELHAWGSHFFCATCYDAYSSVCVGCEAAQVAHLWHGSPYCAECYAWYEEQCVECENAPAEWECEWDGAYYCRTCYDKTHTYRRRLYKNDNVHTMLAACACSVR